ncbi:MAG: hypothetical protein IT492_01955 [Gammaproteobacteria bacterium]|nr:hypothetical protein [Gammaproteobacteria bacterium]
MNSKPSKQVLCALAMALVLGAGASHAAEPSHGLRVVSSRLIESGDRARVETRITRSLANGLLAPQQLRVALIAADGSVRAEQRRVVGPAQLPHHSARDAYLRTELSVAAQPQDRLQVEWLTSHL